MSVLVEVRHVFDYIAVLVYIIYCTVCIDDWYGYVCAVAYCGLLGFIECSELVLTGVQSLVSHVLLVCVIHGNE